jgi:hypothetical protein
MTIDNATIDALRPGTVALDPEWSDATLRAILAEDPPQVRRPTGRRVAIAAFAITLTTVGGVGVAAATTGFSFSSFADTFSYWNGGDRPHVDPSGATRLATAAGPSGSIFSVVGAGDDPTCYTAIIESASSAKQVLPSAFTDITDNYCTDFSGRDRPEFGSASVSYGSEVAGYTVPAGRAARAELTGQDGTTYPALLVDGQFWGWFPKDQHPTLVGYAKDGTRIGETVL